MKVLLVRHGETDWNVKKKIQGSTDIPLNEVGREQAGRLAEELLCKRDEIEGIYTSCLSRASETAEIIAKRLNKECFVLKGVEEINFGLWEGLSWEQVEEGFPREYQVWRENRRYQKPPRGESYQELLERVVPALQKLLREKEESQETRDVVVVTHSADIMSLLSFLNDTPFHEMVKRYKTANTAVIELESEILKSRKIM